MGFVGSGLHINLHFDYIHGAYYYNHPRKHIVVINFIKVSSAADGYYETFNNLMRSQHDAKEICCNILSALFFHS
jgi:hypothetical protein